MALNAAHTIPAFSRAMFTGAMGWLVLAILLAGMVWAAFKAMQGPNQPPESAGASGA